MRYSQARSTIEHAPHMTDHAISDDPPSYTHLHLHPVNKAEGPATVENWFLIVGGKHGGSLCGVLLTIINQRWRPLWTALVYYTTTRLYSVLQLKYYTTSSSMNNRPRSTPVNANKPKMAVILNREENKKILCTK